MKKPISLLLISIVAASHAAEPNAQPHAILGKASVMHAHAAGDKAPTLSELDAILAQLDKLTDTTMDHADQKKALLLRLKVLQSKYSVLESPTFRGDKGGRLLLTAVRQSADQWLVKHPADLDVLRELQLIESTLGIEGRTTIERMLKVAPKDGWTRFISAMNYSRRGQLQNAVPDLMTAVKVEMTYYSAIEYMEKGLELAAEAKCDFLPELRKIVATVPQELNRPGPNPTPKSPEAKRLARKFEETRMQYLNTFEPKQCSNMHKVSHRQ